MNRRQPSCPTPLRLSRRQMLQVGWGMFGLSLPSLLALRHQAQAHTEAATGAGRAKSCIVLYCWGGMSHLETWDPKPHAPREIRGDYRPIATATPGVRIGEYMPLLAQQTQRLAIVRSV